MTYNIKIALVGCGNWGKNIARSLGEMGVLGAICENKNLCETAAALSHQFSVPVLSFEDILKSPDIQAVALATPTATHYALSKATLEAGKHVFVEKPLVQNVQENQELCSLARAQKKVLMVGHILRYHSGYLTVTSLCQNGDLGDVQHVSTRRTNLGRFFPGESALWDLAPHDLSMVLGIFRRMPQRVQCVEHGYVESGVGDFATLTLDFGQNQYASLYFSRYSPQKEQTLIIYGSKGFVTFDDTKPWSEKVEHDGRSVRLEEGMPVIQDGKKTFLELPPQEPLKCELNAFIEAMNTPLKNHSTPEDALEILSIILAAEKSSSQGQWVSL